MSQQRHAIMVVGLGFGDCGKGSIVDFLTRRRSAHTIVRFNGGPQAGHNVVLGDGRHHTFSQFGSGMFVSGVRTLLSRFMLIEPYALFNEARHLAQLGVGDALERLLVDARCLVITPVHQAANRLREIARGAAAHGTCGLGVGEAVQDLVDHPELAIHARDLGDRGAAAGKLHAIRDMKVRRLRRVIDLARTHAKARSSVETLLDPSWIEAAVENYAALAERVCVVDASAARAVLCSAGTVIYEGAQGVLLDENFGFHPHTTWSTTTFANAETLLDDAGHDRRRTRIGVLRTYLTRHGPGPLVAEDAALRVAVPEPHNDDAGWQGRFRVGLFDAVAARYALAAAGPIDALAVTHLDRVERLPPCVCNAYRLERGDAGRNEASDAADYFLGQTSDRIADIRLPQPGDLAHRERLTGMLARCRPVCTSLPAAHADALLDFLGRELRARIGVASFGPTADDKVWSD